MTSDQYREAIAALGLNQVEAAAFLNIGERTSRRWAEKGDVAPAAAMLLRLMVDKKLKPETVLKKYGEG